MSAPRGQGGGRRISDMSNAEFMEWLKPQLPPIDADAAIAHLRARRATALQSPFQNVWLAGGQIPSCVALGHRVYHWSHDGWQVFQHGENEEARYVYLWAGRNASDSEEDYLEDWEAMMVEIREWVEKVHAWEKP